MSLLLAEMLLAGHALKRGWRVLPVLLVALPIAVLGCESTLADLLAACCGAHFDPATARALVHGAALLGLALTSGSEPSEMLAGARALGRRVRPRSGPLYQI